MSSVWPALVALKVIVLVPAEKEPPVKFIEPPICRCVVPASKVPAAWLKLPVTVKLLAAEIARAKSDWIVTCATVVVMLILQLRDAVLSKTMLSNPPGTPDGVQLFAVVHKVELLPSQIFVVPKVQLVLLPPLVDADAFSVDAGDL